MFHQESLPEWKGYIKRINLLSDNRLARKKKTVLSSWINSEVFEFSSMDNPNILWLLWFSEQINHENQIVGDYFNKGELLLCF